MTARERGSLTASELIEKCKEEGLADREKREVNVVFFGVDDFRAIMLQNLVRWDSTIVYRARDFGK